MNLSRIEYFLNAVFYEICLLVIKLDLAIDTALYKIFNSVLRFLLPKEYRTKFIRSNLRARKKSEDIRMNINLSYARYIFGYTYASYPGFIALVIFGIVIGYDSMPKSGLLLVLIPAIPIGLSCISLHRWVFSEDKYAQYFVQFEEEDARWHKKWKRNAIAFCIGGFLTTILGIITAFAIAISM